MGMEVYSKTMGSSMKQLFEWYVLLLPFIAISID